LGQQHVPEGAAESANAGQGADADGNRDDHEQKPGARGADLAPGDAYG
jgi:hypothetical protein